MMNSILPLDPARYRRHRIHVEDRNWAETNCYVDVWIELLHAWGFDPIAALPFTLTIDFEGDQWTFFKFPLSDLLDLYGLDVQELAIWRRLVDHVSEQVALGRPVLVELDSYFLPDTAGTAYRREHVKSTVAVNAIDLEAHRMGYFHNQGYFELAGEDFAKVFRLEDGEAGGALPPYVEFVKRRDLPARSEEELARRSLSLLRRQIGLLPEGNPFQKFKLRFEQDWDWLSSAPLDVFHQYSFATLRQFGACFELSATYLAWLRERTAEELGGPLRALAEISSGAKALQFQLARAMARKKGIDLSAIDAMAEQWQAAMTQLRVRFS